MTTVISSQRYINNQILNEKIEGMESQRITGIVLQAWDVDGEMAVLFDGHHTLEAARQLEINVQFEVISHPDGLIGDDLLEQSWIDSDWYNVETGTLVW